MKNKYSIKNKSKNDTKRHVKTKKHIKKINKNKKKRRTRNKKNLKGGNDEKQIWSENINKFRNFMGQKTGSFKMGIIPLPTSASLKTIQLKPINDQQNISEYKLLPTYRGITRYNKNYWVDKNLFIIRTSTKDPDEAPNFSYANRKIESNRMEINFDISNGIEKFTGWHFLKREMFWLVDESYINQTILYNGLRYTLEKFITDVDKTKVLRQRIIGSNKSDVHERVASRIPVWRDDNGFKIFIGWNQNEILTPITPRLRDSGVHLNIDIAEFRKRLDWEYKDYKNELITFIGKHNLNEKNSRFLDSLEDEVKRDSTESMHTVDL